MTGGFTLKKSYLRLVDEPDNQFDAHAVYVPRDMNQTVRASTHRVTDGRLQFFKGHLTVVVDVLDEPTSVVVDVLDEPTSIAELFVK